MKLPTMISADESFSNVAEAFVLALRSGENPSIEEFAARFPKYAADIRDEFPLILMAEQINAHVKKETNSSSTPKMIGKYRVTGEIGRGGMGRVYAATQEGLNRQVAIKVVNYSGTEQCDSLIRFQREAKSAGKLNHPNIVPVYDYGIQDQMLYFVMPRIRGLDLSRIVDGLSLERSKSSSKSLTMDWRMIAEVGAQVAGALAYAHSQGMVHRDIKPANLIMESEGRVWVTDFGLVKNTAGGDQTLSRTGDLIGTPRYMAPEQLRGLCDARSDIYGLGLTLYELATGKRAWDDLSGTDLITRRSSLELPLIRSVNSEIPDSLCTIIMKCCAFKPDDRYQTASEVQFVFNRYLQGHRVGDRRKARNSERSILKRRPVRLIRATATLCGIAIFGGACYYATQPKNPFEDPYASVSMLKDDQVRKDFIKQIPSIIEQVVQSKDAELRNAVADVAKETLTRELEANETIPDKAKDEIKKHVDRVNEYIVGQQSDGRQTEELSINPLLVQACEFDWVVPQLNNSGLSPREKAAGQRLLMGLKKGILEQRVVQQTVDKLRKSAEKLAVNQDRDNDPNAPAQLTDNSLRTFLGYVELTVSDRNKIDDRVVLPVQQRPGGSGTVVNAIDTALRNPEVRNFLNSLK